VSHLKGFRGVAHVKYVGSTFQYRIVILVKKEYLVHYRSHIAALNDLLIAFVIT
jgi:hypothetical protein